jgi:CRP-like cAMP-binding protein
MPERPDPIAAAREILKRHSIFGSLTVAELDQLLAHARIETHRAKRPIFLKGSPGRGLLTVLKGRVRISCVGPDGGLVLLADMGEGEVFGEIALLDGKDRTADATALADCELLAIDRRNFVPFLKANPDVALRLLVVLCDRLRRTTEQFEDVIFLEGPARLAKKLLQLGEAYRQRTAFGTRPGLKVSQRDLGNMIGLSRESINKQLSAWHRNGTIRVGRTGIVIIDDAALRAYAERD